MTLNAKLIIIILCSLFFVTTIVFTNKINTLQNDSEKLFTILNEQKIQISNLTTVLKDQSRNITASQSTIKKLNHTVFIDGIVHRSYSDLFFSNVTPPVSRLEAVSIALDKGNWTSEKLSGKRLTAVLKWAVFTELYNYTYIFVSIEEVTQPIANYSPIIEGDNVFRYVWQVTVSFTEYEDAEYWVDASSGDFFVSPVYYHVPWVDRLV